MSAHHDRAVWRPETSNYVQKLQNETLQQNHATAPDLPATLLDVTYVVQCLPAIWIANNAETAENHAKKL